MDRTLIDETLGWIGAGLLVLAFALLSFGVLLPTSLVYQSLNLGASIGLLYISLKKKVYQGVVINILWLAVSIFAIGKVLFT